MTNTKKVHLALVVDGTNTGVSRCGFTIDTWAGLFESIFDGRYFTVNPTNITCQSCITLHNVDEREAEEQRQKIRDQDDLNLGRKMRAVLDHYHRTTNRKVPE